MGDAQDAGCRRAVAGSAARARGMSHHAVLALVFGHNAGGGVAEGAVPRGIAGGIGA